MAQKTQKWSELPRSFPVCLPIRYAEGGSGIEIR